MGRLVRSDTELVQVADQRPRRVLDDDAALSHVETGHRLQLAGGRDSPSRSSSPRRPPRGRRTGSPRESARVDGREGAAHDDGDFRVGFLDEPGESLHRRIGRHDRRKRRDHVGRSWRAAGRCPPPSSAVAGVEHPYPVTRLAQHGARVWIAEGREGHHADPAIGRCAGGLGEQVEVRRVSHVGQEDVHACPT